MKKQLFIATLLCVSNLAFAGKGQNDNKATLAWLKSINNQRQEQTQKHLPPKSQNRKRGLSGR